MTNEINIRINNLLSSIIWTAEKLQELHVYQGGLDPANALQTLEHIERLLDIVLDHEETHI